MPTYVLLGLLLVTWAWLIFVAWRSHSRFVGQRDIFRCRVRLVSGQATGLPSAWQGHLWWGRWVHDVLLVRPSGLRRPTRVLSVSTVLGPIAPSPAGRGGVLGPRPLHVRLQLDSGDIVDLAAPEAARDLVTGPFLVAGILGARGTTDRQPPAR